MNLWPSNLHSEEHRIEAAQRRLDRIERFQTHLYEFEALDEPSLEQALEYLGPRLCRLNELPADKNLDSEKFLAAAARKHFRQFPEHADYFLNKFMSIKGEIVKMQSEGAPEAAILNASYEFESDRGKASRDMAAISSPEIATAIAGLLDDGFDYPPGSAQGGPLPNKVIAAGVLEKIIVNPPANVFKLDIWREWRDKVKAGELTFRLVGDPYDLEYNFDGPVEPKNAPLSASTGNHQGSPAGRDAHAGTRSEVKKEHGAFTQKIWYVLAGGLLATAVIVLLRQGRKTRRQDSGDPAA